MELFLAYDYYYILGLLLAGLFLPINFFGAIRLVRIDINNLQYFKFVNSAIVIVSGILVAPYCLPWQLPIILPMFWLMVLYCLIEEYTRVSKDIILYILTVLGMLLAYVIGVDKNTIIISLSTCLLIFATARVSDERKVILHKVCNPILLPIILLNVQYGSYALFFRYVYLSFLGYNFAKIFYAYIYRKKIYSNIIVSKLFNLSKFYCIAWLLVFINNSNHVVSIK